MSGHLDEGSPPFITRHAATRVAEALTDTRVVMIAGPRQSGKSTLARHVIVGRADVTIANLDNETTLISAKADPVGFVQRSGLLMIDEIQRAPELYLAIKASVDRDPRPGRFLLTGSAHIEGELADALVGRMELIELWPFSQSEIERTRPFLIESLFRGEIPDVSSPLSKTDYLERAVAGGYPEAIARTSAQRRGRWYDAHIRAIADREIRQLADVEHPDAFPDLLRLVAARTATLVNVEALARELHLPGSTLRRYLRLLWTAYAIRFIPAWSSNRTKRVTRMPKVILTDTGVACSLLGLDAAGLAGLSGPIVENLCAMEVIKAVDLGWPRISVHHLRTHDAIEVDLVLEAPDGTLVGIEIKSGATVRSADFAGLRYLAARTDDRLAAGIVLYTGTDSLRFGPRMAALPIASLWKDHAAGRAPFDARGPAPL